MAHYSEPEVDLIPAVEEFGQASFPGAVMIFHPTVFWADGAMWHFPDPEAARNVLTAKKTKIPCEVIPDYAFFRSEDVIGAHFKGSRGKEIKRFVPRDSREFSEQIRKTKPISYIWHDEPDEVAWSGRRCVVRLWRGARALAVVDHKGGKTHNITKERRKVVFQGLRFGTHKCFLIVPSPPTVPVKLDGTVPVRPVPLEIPGCELYQISQ